MEFGYIGIIVAVLLFFIGMKFMKWLMWGLAILAVIVAGIVFYF